MTPHRRHVLAQFAGLTLGALPWAAQAQTGGRPIRLMVGYTPGGPNDILARIIAPKLAESLKQTVVVENKPGAGLRQDSCALSHGTARANRTGPCLHSQAHHNP